MRCFTMLAIGTALPSYGAMGRWVRHVSLILFLLAASGAGAGATLRVAALERPDAVTGGVVSDIPWEAVVRNAQRELTALGYYRGPLDGRFNAQLEKALRRFEQKYGVGTDRRSMRRIVERMRSMSAAMHLRRALSDSGRRQQEQAASALRSNPSTRDLLGQGDAVARSQLQSSRKARPHCHSAITVGCLLDEALRSVGDIESDTYRDWALRDVVTAHVRSGNISDIRDTMRRISDPRLILVSLRGVAESMARHGNFAEAAALAATIPDPANRAKGFVAVAVALTKNGDSSGSRGFVDRVLGILNGRPVVLGGVGIATDLAIKLVDEGELALARLAVAAARNLLFTGADETSPSSFARHMVRAAEISMIAAVQADAGHYEAALETLSRKRVEAGLVNSAGYANSVVLIRNRVSALSRLAETQFDRGDRAAAVRTLAIAEAIFKEPRAGRTSDVGRARIARAWMRLKAFDRASMAILEIGNAGRRARLLWLLSDSYLAAGDTGAARLIEEEALAATNSVKNGFSRTAIKSDSALRLAKRGDVTAARRVFALALATGRGITTPWWRARAFARLASTLGGLERLGVRP